MFQLIAFIIALLVTLLFVLKEEKITLVGVIVATGGGFIISLCVSIIGGYIIPEEAVAIATIAEFTPILIAHLWSAFVGAIVPPLAQWLFNYGKTIKVS